ncbi:MAG: cell division protein FtsK [Desulfobulbaceae bacterium]|nr:cell division protein FtsK [Desulfobulbaceae bacterium]
MARDDSRRDKPPLLQELLAVLGIFLSLFLFIALAGFSLPGPEGLLQPHLWGGRIGFFLAQVLMSFLGFSSFWLVFLLLTFSLRFFSPSASVERLPLVFLGTSGVIIASATLLAATGLTSLHLPGRYYPSGGMLGDLFSGLLADSFGASGTLLFSLCLLVVSLMMAAEMSPYLLVCRWRDWRRSRREIQSVRVQPVLEKPPVPEEKKIAQNASITLPNVHEPVRLPAVADDVDDDFQPVPFAASDYRLPGLNLLDKSPGGDFLADRDHYLEVSAKLEEKLNDFGVNGKVSGISPGPVITTYEYEPAPGVKINKVVSLADDLALGLKAESVRIVGSIPGKAALGIEIPNRQRQVVYIRDILSGEEFQKSANKLTIGLGMDVVGQPVTANLAKMPHLLIAGATGAGKSVAVNTIICSFLMKATPEEVRMLMVDPKRIELSCYEGIPHLLHPVVVDPKMASRALQWAVREMERRYQLMEEQRVKSIATYNEQVSGEGRLPLIVIIIDELADLMMVSSKEVEDSVARLAQMARAAGMHLILATQRPSVDVLTGLIKANFPTRMSFKVSSKIDSRTILDSSGAEHLLGAGDMLFLPPGSSRLQRIHGAYITEAEIGRIVNFIKEQRPAVYDESVVKVVETPPESEDGEAEDDFDEKYDEAVAFVCETGQASISMVQRRLRVGYNRAARMIETMEKEGIVGPADGSKAREVLARKTY